VAGYTNGYIYYTREAASEHRRRAGGQRLPARAGVGETLPRPRRGADQEVV